MPTPGPLLLLLKAASPKHRFTPRLVRRVSLTWVIRQAQLPRCHVFAGPRHIPPGDPVSPRCHARNGSVSSPSLCEVVICAPASAILAALSFLFGVWLGQMGSCSTLQHAHRWHTVGLQARLGGPHSPFVGRALSQCATRQRRSLVGAATRCKSCRSPPPRTCPADITAATHWKLALTRCSMSRCSWHSWPPLAPPPVFGTVTGSMHSDYDGRLRCRPGPPRAWVVTPVRRCRPEQATPQTAVCRLGQQQTPTGICELARTLFLQYAWG